MVPFAPTAAAGSLSLEERLQRIETLAARIDAYVKFMCKAASNNGVSTETREKAVTIFHECLINVESQLGRIHDRFRLE